MIRITAYGDFDKKGTAKSIKKKLCIFSMYNNCNIGGLCPKNVYYASFFGIRL